MDANKPPDGNSTVLNVLNLPVQQPETVVPSEISPGRTAPRPSVPSLLDEDGETPFLGEIHYLQWKSSIYVFCETRDE